MDYRLYDFEKNVTVCISDNLREVIKYFNTEFYDNYDNCLIQEWNGEKYISII